MGSFLLRISPHETMFKVSWTIVDGDDTASPGAYLIDAGLLQQAAVAVRQQLRVIAFARTPFEQTEFATLLRRLAQRGKVLFLQLMDPASDPPEVRQRFEQLAQASTGIRHDLKIILETDQLFVPWGFVFAGRVNDLPPVPTLSLADMTSFWLSHFNISITYNRTKPLPRQRKTSARKLFALHEVMFTEAKELLKAEDRECLERLDKLIDDNMTPAMDWEKFREAWEVVGNQHDSVLYLFGHSNGQRIELRDKTTGKISEEDDPIFDLNASGLIELKKEQPGESAAIFLFNGCRTAAPIPDSKEMPISANFLKATSERGYFGFIGTETQVSNVFACRYGTEFLWRLFQEGKSVGEAFDDLLNNTKLFPQNLLYSCYAERKFRFVLPQSSEKQP